MNYIVKKLLSTCLFPCLLITIIVCMSMLLFLRGKTTGELWAKNLGRIWKVSVVYTKALCSYIPGRKEKNKFDVHRAVLRNIFLYSNQLHTPMYQIYFVLFWNGTLHVSVFPSNIRSSILYVRTARGVCQTDTAVCLLANSQQYLFGCCMYSLEPLMMDGKTVRNM